jgi:hypothetical protein
MVTQGGKPLGIGSRLPDFEHSPLHPRRYPCATGCLGCLTLQIRSGQMDVNLAVNPRARLLHLDVGRT